MSSHIWELCSKLEVYLNSVEIPWNPQRNVLERVKSSRKCEAQKQYKKGTESLSFFFRIFPENLTNFDWNWRPEISRLVYISSMLFSCSCARKKKCFGSLVSLFFGFSVFQFFGFSPSHFLSVSVSQFLSFSVSPFRFPCFSFSWFLGASSVSQFFGFSIFFSVFQFFGLAVFQFVGLSVSQFLGFWVVSRFPGYSVTRLPLVN